MSSRFISVVVYVRVSKLFKARCYSVLCMWHVLFFCSFLSEHLSCFHLLGVAAMNVTVQIALCVLLPILWVMYPEVSIGFCGIVDSFLCWRVTSEFLVLLILHLWVFCFGSWERVCPHDGLCYQLDSHHWAHACCFCPASSVPRVWIWKISVQSQYFH